MSVRRLKQNILSIMVFANDLWLFIGRFKATLPHPIWIEHLAKRVMFCLFFRFTNAHTPPPPLPYGGNGGSLLTRGCGLLKNSGSAYAIVQQHFFHNILQGISIIYTNNKLNNSKCQNCRHVLLQRAGEILTFAFQARALQFIFLSDRFFLCYFFYSFCNTKINKLYKQK